uniref:Fe2OG dioxygenase domain-containing protein n=1 Tax=viral metagenome TaxID=1070528 RepID=A0A6C0LRW6_9ZZZZ
MKKIILNNGKSKLWIIENFSDDLFKFVEDISLHEEPPIIIMGKECRQRRNVGFFSDENEGYKYSGKIMIAESLSTIPILCKLLRDVNDTLDANFNGILINQYINGEKYIGAHSDDEKGLDPKNNIVASIAYGVPRTFRIRNKITKQIVLNFVHKPCTLLVMEGNFQKDFTHEIPIEKKVKGERISFTFRHHLIK